MTPTNLATPTVMARCAMTVDAITKALDKGDFVDRLPGELPMPSSAERQVLLIVDTNLRRPPDRPATAQSRATQPHD